MIGGGDKKKKRKNIAPQSPRFLPSAQMTGERRDALKRPKPAKAKKKKPKTVNYNTRGKGMKMLCAGYGKGRRTPKSCRN
tara:strand:- start:698 stop:937 length:240 start_codon:yes stop_codon:yes gene_type:complete